jgi:hypothetical protein
MRLSERIYRILLKAYPERFLLEYEAPMKQLFLDQLRDANAPAKLGRLWLRTSVDLIRTVPVRYFEPRRHPALFQRWNESARRSLFFARYTAEGSGHAEITPQDLLAGVVREDKALRRLLPAEALEEIRQTLGGNPPQNRMLRRHVPLSEDCKRVLWAAQSELERTGRNEILPRHLVAAIIRDENTPAAQLLLRHDLGPERFE